MAAGRNSFKHQTSRPTRATRVNKSKVYSNHFASGYCCDTSDKPILNMKDYPDEGNNVKARENIDTKGKRKQHSKPDSEPSVKQCRDSYLEKESD